MFFKGLQPSDLQPETLDEGGAGARSLENTALGKSLNYNFL